MALVEGERESHNDDDDEEEEDNLTISQLSLRNHNIILRSSPSKKPLETRNNPFRARKMHFSLNHTVKQEQFSDNLQKHESNKKSKRTIYNYSCDNVKGQSTVMERAEEVKANLAAEFPSFKSMCPSNVNQKFYLKLPKKFYELHMSWHNTAVILIDEHGEEYRTNFRAQWRSLLGGQKRFCHANKLLAVISGLKKKRKNSSEGDRDLSSNSLEGIRIPISDFDFSGMRSIENFTISVNGVTIDSELSKVIRTRYYELCCSQRIFLHDHLLQNINPKLACEIISETTRIADAIRSSKLSTPGADYEIWEKTLSGFELLGMNVGFLIARIKWLMNLSLESKEALKLRSPTSSYRKSCVLVCLTGSLVNLECELVPGSLVNLECELVPGVVTELEI
ncbi:B3 domain-containing protein [Quillaja saponaria]|uniref:B3 domain-containing protein n=1 Tax=Quillaja saponaria TaxID=32244 RepID=A0AAD7LZY9_QUISA|nr:B3 domain-containing protein [Quillaja saponaria]